MAFTHIHVRGARVHNLQNVTVELPRDKLVVLTGLSGSGKSSLAFDTIYAEGQRRYVESLSSYARQFLQMQEKPDVDGIDGLSPAISIEQKTTSKNPRSTVATVTEIADYLRLLYARVGQPECYGCGRLIEGRSASQIVDEIARAAAPKQKLSVLAPIVRHRKGAHVNELAQLRKEGFVRARIDGRVRLLEEDIDLSPKQHHTVEVVVDRLVWREQDRARLADAVELALRKSKGLVAIVRHGGGEGETEKKGEKKDQDRLSQNVASAGPARQKSSNKRNLLEVNEHSETIFNEAGTSAAVLRQSEETLFSEHFSCPDCGISYPELEPRMFSFNAPQGACSACDGLGGTLSFAEHLVIPNPRLAVAHGVIAPLRNQPHGYHSQMVRCVAQALNVSLYTPWDKLPNAARQAILNGTKQKIGFTLRGAAGETAYQFNKPYEGVLRMLQRRYRETTSQTTRDEFERYMVRMPCSECDGTRLRKEARHVRVGGKGIGEVMQLSIGQAEAFFKQLRFTGQRAAVAQPIVREIAARLSFLTSVGLTYLTLDRCAGTLSGGEAQRIRLASQVGSALVGVLYVLDEPSIGLHQRDNERLLGTLKHLRDLGNTVLVVEHDEDTIRAADHVVDMGPGAGRLGGHIVAQGTPSEIGAHPDSLTGDYLSGRRCIAVPARRREHERGTIELTGAAGNNLKDVNVAIPLGTLTCVAGVSGSGKSSLIMDTLYPALARAARLGIKAQPLAFRELHGSSKLDKIIDIDQSTIGRTPRSNPATYVGVFDGVRRVFASLPESGVRGYKPGRFSFNVKGGRCEACQGAGLLKIEMNFLADVYVTCDTCDGKRFNAETLAVTYRDKTIADVLELTVDEAAELFTPYPDIARMLQALRQVGLGYIHLGQQATTLSGGEAQRVKLAKELSRRATGRTLYILDEPTTGLHFADVAQLLEVLQHLVEQGNTVTVIEHNLDVIKVADWVIDMGPEGGDKGGRLVVAGTPEQVARHSTSHTGRFLRSVLKQDKG
ncbi:MAG: excinuclease ABC subunit UvrA [Myxococcota bacterium]